MIEGRTIVALSGNQSAQHAYLWDMDPGWTLYIGGLGSGKTWAAARKLLMLHCYNECPSLMVAPTYADLWRTMVPALEQAAREGGLEIEIYPAGKGSLQVPHAIVRGQPIFLMSGEAPERIAGFEVGTAWVDEAARLLVSRDNPLRDAPTQIRSRLRHPKAKILHGTASTTPEGTDTWIQRDWFDAPKPHHRWYRGKTRANRHLPAEYIAALEAAYPPELARQYLDGEAVCYAANRAHPGFRPAVHVHERADWKPGLPAHLGADYNVAPMCWIVGQKVGDEFHVVDEVVLPDFGQVDAAMHAAHAKGWAKGRPVHLHPDRSAKSRSTVGDPEFVVMTQCAKALGWQWSGNASGANPPVSVRINLVSRMLCDAVGRSRIVIHPRCKVLIENLERTGRLASGQYDPGPEGKRGHILDAFGYALWDVFPPVQRAGAVALP